jgi:hypothetical protein
LRPTADQQAKASYTSSSRRPTLVPLGLIQGGMERETERENREREREREKRERKGRK